MIASLFFISQYGIKTVEASSIIDKNNTLNVEENSIVLNSGENATGTTTGNISIPSTLKDTIIKKLRTDLEWDFFNVYCEKGFYTISYLKKDDIGSSNSSHEVFTISTDIICVKDLPYITGNEIFKRIPPAPYTSSNIQSSSQQPSTIQSSNPSSTVPWWCFWCTKLEPAQSTNNTKDNTNQQDSTKNIILQNTTGQSTGMNQSISVAVNNTTQFSDVSNIYNNSAKNSTDTIKLPDGSIKLTDGRIILSDGSIKHPNGTIKRPDGTIILPDGMPIFPNIFNITQETKNFTNSH